MKGCLENAAWVISHNITRVKWNEYSIHKVNQKIFNPSSALKLFGVFHCSMSIKFSVKLSHTSNLKLAQSLVVWDNVWRRSCWKLCFEGIVPGGWTPQSRRHFCNKSASALTGVSCGDYENFPMIWSKMVQLWLYFSDIWRKGLKIWIDWAVRRLYRSVLSVISS